ncbi:MAG: 3-oxoacyl-ACP synthase [Flavobacteriales bacterium]|nr:3-oxoacyl-ACP synthase [Flavobacteriales bacterium]|tara:strand:+ start:5673 stop:6623 length:951 start_codon:yes stop_codon:yes gene_type:complete
MKFFVEYPENILSNSNLEDEFSDVDINRLEKKLGIKKRRIVAKNETALDLAKKVCSKISAEDLDQIDFLLYCTQTPEYFLPSTACVLQNEIGLRKTCGAFDFNLGCSGYIYGLAMAKSFLQSGVATKVLFVTSETYSKHLHKEDWSNRSIFGDAATATIIEDKDVKKIGLFDLGTDGEGAENLIVKGGAGKSNFEQNFERDNLFFMNGPEVFKFTLENVPITVQSCLDKNGKSMEDIDYVIFHQANAYMLKKLRKKVNVSDEKFYINVESIGNTVSNTIPIAIDDSLKRGLIKSGDCLLLCGFGVGYSWGSTLITI